MISTWRSIFIIQDIKNYLEMCTCACVHNMCVCVCSTLYCLLFTTWKIIMCKLLQCIYIILRDAHIIWNQEICTEGYTYNIHGKFYLRRTGAAQREWSAGSKAHTRERKLLQGQRRARVRHELKLTPSKRMQLVSYIVSVSSTKQLSRCASTIRVLIPIRWSWIFVIKF